MSKVILLIIDGLRRDVFFNTLSAGKLPNVKSLLGSEDVKKVPSFNTLSVLPSVTFPATVSMLTGSSVGIHGISGNSFFDRVNLARGSKEKRYLFDSNNIRGVLDCFSVYGFKEGIIDKLILKEASTLFQRSKNIKKSSITFNSILSKGAVKWIRPSLFRLLKTKKYVGSKNSYHDTSCIDKEMVHEAKKIFSRTIYDLSVLHFLGLDFYSHAQGPQHQSEYLIECIDPLIGELLQSLHPSILKNTVFIIASDHGQIETGSGKGFLFPIREITTLAEKIFQQKNSIIACTNGGSAHIYIRKRNCGWEAPPDFEEDVLPSLNALLEAISIYSSRRNQKILDRAFVRKIEGNLWNSPYNFVMSDKKMHSIDEYLKENPIQSKLNIKDRLLTMSSSRSGDIFLIPNQEAGIHFGPAARGTHGGISREESESVLVFGNQMNDAFETIKQRQFLNTLFQETENDSTPGIQIVTPLIEELLQR
jgi:hypothetical protein